MNVRATLMTWNARLHRLTNQMTAVRTWGRGQREAWAAVRHGMCASHAVRHVYQSGMGSSPPREEQHRFHGQQASSPTLALMTVLALIRASECQTGTHRGCVSVHEVGRVVHGLAKGPADALPAVDDECQPTHHLPRTHSH